MSNGGVDQYELHGLDIPGGHQTPPGPSSPSDSEGEAVVLVFVHQEVVVGAVEDLLTGGTLAGGWSLTQETFSCSTQLQTYRENISSKTIIHLSSLYSWICSYSSPSSLGDHWGASSVLSVRETWSYQTLLTLLIKANKRIYD